MSASAFLRAIPRNLAGNEVDGPYAERRSYFVICLAVLILTLPAFIVPDLLAERYSEAIPAIGLLATGLVALGLNRFLADPRWSVRLVLGELVLLFAWFLYLGSGEGFAFVWFYFLPAPLYYMFSDREGSAWVALSFGLSVTILATDLGVAYPSAIAIRFAVTYGLVSLLSMLLAQSRETAHASLAIEMQNLKDALAEVRTLSGMLPMCAWCRKVRDDDGYWSQIEEYLDQHVGTQISHSICPACATKERAEAEAPTDGWLSR